MIVPLPGEYYQCLGGSASTVFGQSSKPILIKITFMFISGALFLADPFS